MRKSRLMKQIAAAACVAAMLAGLAACGSKPAQEEAPAASGEEQESPKGQEESPAASGEVVMVGEEGAMSAEEFGMEAAAAKKYTIAVVVKNAALPVWEAHITAAQKAGEALGVEVIDYSPTKADNVEEQKRILEDLITTGVDAVILAPANTEAVKGPVQELIDAGIPVIYDNTMGPSDVDYLTYVGIDNYEAGVIIAEAMVEKMGEEGNVLVMEGVPGQSTSDIRTEAVMDTLANYPGITAERGVTNWMTDEGRKMTEDYITKWGDDLKACISVGGNQAEGSVEAIKAAGMEGRILVNGFDVQEPQVAAVENGDEVFTVSQGVYYQSYLSVVAAVRALNGESVPRQINCPITIVDQNNLEEMDERPEAFKAR